MKGMQTRVAKASPAGVVERALSETARPALDSNPDAALVKAARRGDCAAFSALYNAHSGWLLAVLWRLAGGDKGLAEDWLQDAFVLAWNRLDQLREPGAFGGWLKRLAVNVALSEKRRGTLTRVDVDAEASAPEPPWPCADLDLERAIARLPARARQVLVLFHLSDLGHAEIAALMGIEPGTSKAQLHRARTLLKEMLG